MEDNHNFRLNWLAYLVPASPELVTAQPQLVIVLIMFPEGGGLDMDICKRVAYL